MAAAESSFEFENVIRGHRVSKMQLLIMKVYIEHSNTIF